MAGAPDQLAADVRVRGPRGTSLRLVPHLPRLLCRRRSRRAAAPRASSRYIFDLYHKYQRISRELYDYCVHEVGRAARGHGMFSR